LGSSSSDIELLGYSLLLIPTKKHGGFDYETELKEIDELLMESKSLLGLKEAKTGASKPEKDIQTAPDWLMEDSLDIDEENNVLRQIRVEIEFEGKYGVNSKGDADEEESPEAGTLIKRFED
jgi:hypothetical protein